MKEIKIVGLDPTISNCGIAVGRVLLPSLELKIDEVIYFGTEKEGGKQVRKNSDDLRRAEELTMRLAEVAQGAAMVFSEIPTGAQSARASWMLGMTVGVLGLFRLIGVPLVQVQPTETKLASIGKKTASKKEIIDWAVAKFPDAGWPYVKRKGELLLVEGKAEHQADAVAVIHAGIRTNQFKQAIALLGGIARVA